MACSDDVAWSGKASEGQHQFVVELAQDWDQPVSTRSNFSEASPEQSMLQAEGMIGGQPVYVYSTEVDGISAYALPVVVDSKANHATRGILHGTAANRFHDSFCAYASMLPTGGRVISPNAVTVSPESATWYLDKPLLWPDDNPVQFYALAPYAHYAGVSASSPVLTYETPVEALQQEDLMAATASGRSSDAEILFSFKHILSAVKFKIGDKGLANPHNNTKIKQISISGIHTKGSYDIASNTWTLDMGTTGLVRQATDWPGLSLEDRSIGANLMVTSDVDGTTFLLLPQHLPSGAMLSVSIEENGVTKNITTMLSGQWRQGHTITYNITSSNDYPGYILEVENALPLTYDHTGMPTGTNQLMVRSYLNDAAKTPVAWSIDGYANEGGAWSTTNTTFAHQFKVNNIDGLTSGSGGQVGDELRIPVVDARPKTIIREDYRRQSALSARPEQTERKDLSLYKVDNVTLWPGGRNSANSYIVRQAGKYKIPLAAGNSIRNGQFYSYSGTGNNVFVNYQDNVMRDQQFRYLVKAGTSAQLLWQDAAGLVEVDPVVKTDELTIDGTKVYYLYFDVPKATICQGNAVIVVKEGSTIVWSFHIYVTDTDWTQTVDCQAQTTDPVYHFAPEYLGYVERTYQHVTYDARSMQLRIRQNVSGQSAAVTLNQLAAESYVILPFAVHYEFGRKDAFPGIEPYYGSQTVNPQYKQMTVGTSIQNPLMFTIGNSRSDWYMRPGTSHPSWPNVANFWSAGNTRDADNSLTPYNDDAVLKTIYDPCPAGFHVPPSNAFLFTTKRTKESTLIDGRGSDYYMMQTFNTSAEWNAVQDSKYDFSQVNGFFFYTRSNSDSSTPTIYFPVCGRRSAGNGKLSGLSHLVASATGKGGFLWCATPYHQGWSTGTSVSTHPATGCLFSMFSNQVNSRANGAPNSAGDYNYRTAGLCILPVIDQESGIY